MAQNTQWINGSGSWLSPTKWTAGVPTASSNGIFNLIGMQSVVTLSNTSEIISGRMTLQRGSVRFMGSSSTPMNLVEENAFAAALTVGTLTGESAAMQFTGGVPITAKSVDIALAPQIFATLDISLNLSQLVVTNALRVGVIGSGYCYARGAAITANTLEVGVTAGSFGLLMGSVANDYAGEIHVADQCTAGLFGSGEIRSGIAGMDCGALMLGQNNGSWGVLRANGAVQVRGRTTIGYRGGGVLELTSTLSAMGGVTMALESGQSPAGPAVAPSVAFVTIDGGSIVSSADVAIGVGGEATVEMRGGASIESTENITMNGANTSDPINITLPTIPTANPCFSAPTMTGVRASLFLSGSPASGSVWHIARLFSGAFPTCTINSIPDAGLQLKLIACQHDLYLALFPVGAADPEVCASNESATIVPDAIGITSRLFGQGGIAIGNGWYCVGSPGVDGGVDVYRSVNGNWMLDATLVSPEPARVLGAAVAASGARLAARTTDGARVFTFVRADGHWQLEQAIDLGSESTNPTSRSLALDGSTLVVGDPYFDAGSIADVGRATIHALVGGVWVVESVVGPDALTANQRFGAVVTNSGNQCAIGSLANGTVTLFDRVDSAWALAGFVTSMSSAGDIAMHGDELVTGASARFWRQTAGVWNASGRGGVGSEFTAMLGKMSFDGSTAAYLGSSTISTYHLMADGMWRMGQSITPPASEESLLKIAVSDPLICLARSASVVVYGSLPSSTCPSDFDGDGEVGGADLTFVLSAWGDSPLGDLNNDGVTNGLDLAYVLSAWGACQ
ncbi:MAG: hypothetical protein EXS17_06735 [Phycisphaerales bacterium]|nr:hypothetical protein [Phycisphaerales bacterium]